MGGTRILGRSGNPDSFGNADIVVFASAARTATTNSADITNDFGRAAHIFINVTAKGTAPSVVFEVQGKDATSGSYYAILTAAAMTTVTTKILRVVPGLTAVANLTVSDTLPRTWRVVATHANGDSFTYSVGASILL
jgi:hypothetical protein